MEIGIDNNITALYVTVGDLDGDDSPDIIVRMNDRYIYAIGLNGEALDGYPYNTVERSGSFEAGIFVHYRAEEAGIYILPLRFLAQGSCLQAFQGDGIYDDFPGEIVEDIDAGASQVIALYPDINNHRLLIAHNLMVGSLILWEYPMDLGGLVIDWQSAGNTNGGNRVYAPFPVVPHRNQPPRITEFEPNETDLQVVPGTEIQFRISGEDPDFDPLTYLFMLNEDTITHLNFASLNFAHPGRFLVTGRITDLEDLRDSVIWQVDVRPAERVPIDDDRQMTEFGEKSNELSNRGRKFAESEFTYKQSPLPEAFNVHFYPNPFNSRVTVRLELPEAMNLQVSIYNILGQEIATLAKGGYQVGICEWIFNGEGYSTGIYFLHVRSSKKADKIYKFVLLK